MLKTPAQDDFQSGFRSDLIQRVVDELARTIGRSIEVVTASLHVVSASAQYGPIDARRADSILRRTPPLEPLPWLLAYGIQTSREPIRIPANPEYEMLARVCIPLWWENTLRGHIWIIDAPSIDDLSLKQAREVGPQLAELLAVSSSPRLKKLERMQELIVRIAERTPGAFDAAIQEGFLMPSEAGAFTVRSVICADPDAALAAWDTNSIGLIGYLNGELYVVGDAPRNPQRVGSASGADLPGLFPRARFTAGIAKLLNEPCLDWGQLGAWRLLYGKELTSETVVDISPDAAHLVQSVSETVWRSVLAYLDNARAVEKTAKEMFIHRATLHYRLDKARGYLRPGVLDGGWEAVALHIALKLHAYLTAQFGAQSSRQVL